MLDPSELLAVARLLLSAGPAQPPSEAQLRRAVSTAYYGLFHKVLRAGAERFMGVSGQQSAGYTLLYRGFDHGRMAKVCKSLNKGNPDTGVRQKPGSRPAVSQAMRDFASGFVQLQEERYRADYDPSSSFKLSDSENGVKQAEAAMTAFDQAPPDEKADVLALMLVGSR